MDTDVSRACWLAPVPIHSVPGRLSEEQKDDHKNGDHEVGVQQAAVHGGKGDWEKEGDECSCPQPPGYCRRRAL